LCFNRINLESNQPAYRFKSRLKVNNAIASSADCSLLLTASNGNGSLEPFEQQFMFDAAQAPIDDFDLINYLDQDPAAVCK
jgi:hypothetical protein